MVIGDLSGISIERLVYDLTPADVDSTIATLRKQRTTFEKVDRAVQVHGAAGVSDETILERCYRDVRPMRIYEGSSEAMRSVIARNILAVNASST